MQNPILQTSDTSWTTSSRGNRFTIRFHEDAPAYRRWTVMVENASTRAWRGLGLSQFDSIEAVEAKYKSLRGIAALVASPAATA